MYRNYLLGLVMMLGLLGGAQAEVSVAYVDMARLLKDAPQIGQIKQKIRDEFAARDQRLTEMQRQIALLDERLASAGEGMTEDEKRRLQNDLSARKLKYKHMRDELDQDKQLRFSEEEERFSRIIREVIQQMAQDEKLDLVLQGNVLWASPRVDLTGKALKRLQDMRAQGE
jgi:outer membrane protein